MTCGREAACYVVCLLDYSCDLLVEWVALVGYGRDCVKEQCCLLLCVYSHSFYIIFLYRLVTLLWSCFPSPVMCSLLVVHLLLYKLQVGIWSLFQFNFQSYATASTDTGIYDLLAVASLTFHELDCQHTEDTRSVMLDHLLGTLFLSVSSTTHCLCLTLGTFCL